MCEHPGPPPPWCCAGRAPRLPALAGGGAVPRLAAAAGCHAAPAHPGPAGGGQSAAAAWGPGVFLAGAASSSRRRRAAPTHMQHVLRLRLAAHCLHCRSLAADDERLGVGGGGRQDLLHVLRAPKPHVAVRLPLHVQRGVAQGRVDGWWEWAAVRGPRARAAGRPLRAPAAPLASPVAQAATAMQRRTCTALLPSCNTCPLGHRLRGPCPVEGPAALPAVAPHLVVVHVERRAVGEGVPQRVLNLAKVAVALGRRRQAEPHEAVGHVARRPLGLLGDGVQVGDGRLRPAGRGRQAQLLA